MEETKKKFCKHCGERIEYDAVFCVFCGRQVEELKVEKQFVSNNNYNKQPRMARELRTKEVDKATALVLCIFLGWMGAHKFYEENIGMGVLYFFTMGLFGIGWIIDAIVILGKPDKYLVNRM